MGIKKVIKQIARGILKEEIDELVDETYQQIKKVEYFEDKYKEALELLEEKSRMVESLNGQLTEQVIESQEAEYWNNKWKKNRLLYKTDGEIDNDVRNMIRTKSYVLEKVASKFKEYPYDERALKVLSYVKKRVRYNSDINIHNKLEYWQIPEETYKAKRGDCEDGALLIASLLRMSGVPAYRVKIACGMVQDPANPKKTIGHAYCIYLAEDGEWYNLDWCYWPNESIKNFKKGIPHKENKKYKTIWWTFNDVYSWSQKSMVIE